MSHLLDTCILVDLMRQRADAETAVKKLPQRPCVCAFSAMELYAGARSQRGEPDVASVLGLFQWTIVDATTFRRAGSLIRHYHPSHGLDIADALIAAAAQQHDLKLVTLVVKNFPMFPKLKPAY